MDREVRRLFEDVADCVREINERIDKLDKMMIDLADKVSGIQDDKK